MKTCISITTFKKNAALVGILNSIVDIGKENVSCIHIADDNDGEALPVVEEFQAKYESGNYPYSFNYSTGERKGIAVNKNRGIKFFLEERKKDDFLLLLDDDLRINNSRFGSETLLAALIEAQISTDFPHITLYLDDYNDPLTSKHFFSVFPPFAENEWVYHCLGSQGIGLFFTRLAVESAGYFDRLPAFYSYEHCLYSMRVNRMSGRMPEDYILLKNCHRYIKCQGVPNNYEVGKNDLELNGKFYHKRKEDIYRGIDLTVKNPHV